MKKTKLKEWIDEIALLSAYLGAMIYFVILTLSNLSQDNFWYQGRNTIIAIFIGIGVCLQGIIILFVHMARKTDIIKDYEIAKLEREKQEIKNK